MFLHHFQGKNIVEAVRPYHRPRRLHAIEKSNEKHADEILLAAVEPSHHHGIALFHVEHCGVRIGRYTGGRFVATPVLMQMEMPDGCEEAPLPPWPGIEFADGSAGARHPARRG